MEEEEVARFGASATRLVILPESVQTRKEVVKVVVVLYMSVLWMLLMMRLKGFGLIMLE